jgi:hypothetical protein
MLSEMSFCAEVGSGEYLSSASHVAGGSILPMTGKICCSIAQVASFWLAEVGLSSTITS